MIRDSKFEIRNCPVSIGVLLHSGFNNFECRRSSENVFIQTRAGINLNIIHAEGVKPIILFV
jgi:hypothetical protein